MDVDRTRRLQYFLTIMDTIHDFGDSKRLDITNNDTSSLRSKVLWSLGGKFFEAVEREEEIANSKARRPIKDLYKKMYTSYYKGPIIPVNFHDVVIDVTMSILTEFYEITITKESVTNKTDLYQFLRNLYETVFIKYVLDKNRQDNDIFCLEPSEVQRLVQTEVSHEYLKSVFRGKFTEYDNQWNKFSGRQPLNALVRNISSYFTFQSGGDLNPSCVLDGDVFDYQLTKEDNELFLFDRLGVRRNGNAYAIYHVINNRESIIDVGKYPPNSAKGLTLFARSVDAVLQGGTSITLQNIEQVSLKTIAKVFKLSCNVFKTPSDIVLSTVQLSQEYFIHALYDLKRAMDYLAVKACAMGNSRKAFSNTKLVYVSQDRFAILYALVMNCPSILTDSDDSLIVYKMTPKAQTGGMLKVASPNNANKMSFEEYNASMSDEERDAVAVIHKIKLDDIVDTDNMSMFHQFVKQYRRISGSDYMDFLWYVIYRTLFSFIE